MTQAKTEEEPKQFGNMFFLEKDREKSIKINHSKGSSDVFLIIAPIFASEKLLISQKRSILMGGQTIEQMLQTDFDLVNALAHIQVCVREGPDWYNPADINSIINGDVRTTLHQKITAWDKEVQKKIDAGQFGSGGPKTRVPG